MSDPLLAVENLKVEYTTRSGTVRAVDDVSFTVNRGQVLGIVGESGCGKTTLAMSLMRLLPKNARIVGGHVVLDGTDLLDVSEEEVRRYRWNRVSMIFQAAMNSLDPVYKVGDQIIEAIEYNTDSSRTEAQEKVRELFDLVGLERSLIRRYPHEFSGGMRQRAIIAMALACDPDLVIADEPTTALDVIVQDRILREIKRIQQRLDMSMVYISHDMAVIAEISDTVAVMYAGKIVEMGTTEDIFARPRHPYTQALLSAFPSITGEKKELESLMGDPPSLSELPSGCRFHPRCPYAIDDCKIVAPPTVKHGGHWTACWNPLEVRVATDATAGRTARAGEAERSASGAGPES